MVVTEFAVYIVTVHYHQPGAIRNLLSSLVAQRDDVQWQLVVVDNGSTSAECALLLELCGSDSRVFMLAPEKNLGYLGGAAFGRRWIEQRSDSVQGWLVVCNQDVELAPTFLGVLVGLGSRPHGGVVAPRVTTGAGDRDLNPFMPTRPGRLRTILRLAVFTSLTTIQVAVWANSWRWRLSAPPQVAASKAGAIYAPHGSVIVFSSEYFVRGGSLAWSSFMFGEEVFIAEEARRIGVEVIYEPSLSAVHHEHSTTSGRRDRTILRHKRQGVRSASLLILHSS